MPRLAVGPIQANVVGAYRPVFYASNVLRVRDVWIMVTSTISGGANFAIVMGYAPSNWPAPGGDEIVGFQATGISAVDATLRLTIKPGPLLGDMAVVPVGKVVVWKQVLTSRLAGTYSVLVDYDEDY